MHDRDPPFSDDPSVLLPEGLPLLRLRVTLRLLDDARLPAYKGGMLRGGFGYAFQRASCPEACWGAEAECPVVPVCPYRQVFAPPHPPDVAQLHDLRDVPRPFVLGLPNDQRETYLAGEALEFGLTLIGRGCEYLPFFVYGFERLGALGLGRDRVPARLERVEALAPWQPVGDVVYQDGRMPADAALPLLDGAEVLERAERLPAEFALSLRSPLRIKARGEWMRQFDTAALVRAVCWRLGALSAFYGAAPWTLDYRPLLAQAAALPIRTAQLDWVDWERTSTRGGTARRMNLGGLVGRVVLADVPYAVAAVLLMGSLIHAGKACVFGHGAYRIEQVG